MTQVLGIGCGLLVIGVLVADLVRTPDVRRTAPPRAASSSSSDPIVVWTLPSLYAAVTDREIVVRGRGDPEQFTFGATWPDDTAICAQDGACLTLGALRRQEWADR